jgi:hypothetical protein
MKIDRVEVTQVFMSFESPHLWGRSGSRESRPLDPMPAYYRSARLIAEDE